MEVKTPNLHIQQTDARTFLKSLPSSSVQCVVCDPPFGLGEEDFGSVYFRDKAHVVEGYTPAPTENEAYEAWIREWIQEIPRVLRPDGTFYLVMGWNHLCDAEIAIRKTPLKVLNHIVWKYNFGVHTQNKFVSSHYHILRCGLCSKPAFYPTAFYNETDLTEDGKKAQYADLEDVWVINKEYKPGQQKNINKLPEALVRKMILYATRPEDVVADFFMGNFTTAYVALQTGRKAWGCEINPNAFTLHAEPLSHLTSSEPVPEPKASTKPSNAGKRLSSELKQSIVARWRELKADHTKTEATSILEKEFERGHWSITRILKDA